MTDELISLSWMIIIDVSVTYKIDTPLMVEHGKFQDYFSNILIYTSMSTWHSASDVQQPILGTARRKIDGRKCPILGFHNDCRWHITAHCYVLFMKRALIAWYHN